MRATTIVGQNAFASTLCFAQVSLDNDKNDKKRVIRLRVIEGPNARDQIALCAFHSFLQWKSKRMLAR